MRRKRRFGLGSIWLIGLLIAVIVADFSAAKSFLRRRGHRDEIPVPAAVPVPQEEEGESMAAQGEPMETLTGRALSRSTTVLTVLTLLLGLTFAVVFIAGGALAWSDWDTSSVGWPAELDQLTGDNPTFDRALLNDGAKLQYANTDLSDGTGNLNPFLTIQNTPTETGYNSNGDNNEFDEKRFTNFTHSILLSEIPVVDGFLQFVVDMNETEGGGGTGIDPISLDELEIWVVDADDAADPKTSIGPYGSWTAPDADLVFQMGGEVLLNDGVSGSGQADLEILIPQNLLDAYDCDYGDLSCSHAIIMYTDWGNYDAVPPAYPYGSNATFEEIAVFIYPAVSVVKTASGAITQQQNWTLSKTGVDEDLWAEETAVFDWNIALTKDEVTELSNALTGIITVTNTTFDGGKVKIVDVVDTLDDASIDICSELIGVELGKDAFVECEYSLDDAALAEGGTNEIIITIKDASSRDADLNPYYYDDSVDYTTSVVTINETVTVLDGATEVAADVSDSDSWPVAGSFTCDPIADLDSNGEVTTLYNTASLEDIEGSSTTGSSTFGCWYLEAEKTAIPQWSRDYDWSVNKIVDPTIVHLWDGESATLNWTVDVDRWIDSETWSIGGDIKIWNPRPDMHASVGVTDMFAGMVMTVTCGSSTVPMDTPAAGDPGLTCTYASGPQDALGAAGAPPVGEQTNTATISQTTATAEGLTYQPTAPAEFVAPAETDDTATLGDDLNTDWNPAGIVVSGGDTYPYSTQTSCDGLAAEEYDNGVAVFTVDNLATLDWDGPEHDESLASTTVKCYQPDVTKTVDEVTYEIPVTWGFKKSVDPTVVHLFDGDEANPVFTITPSVTEGVPTYGVKGTITITNPRLDRSAVVDFADELFSSTPASLGNATVTGCTVPGDPDPVALALTDNLDGSYTIEVPKSTTATCDYEWSATGGDAPGLNRVDAGWDPEIVETVVEYAHTEFDTEPVVLPAPTYLNANATVYDDLKDTLTGDDGMEPFSYDGLAITPLTVTYPYPVSCDAVTYVDKEASFPVTNNLWYEAEKVASASVTVNCYEVVVSKTASTDYTRTYTWDIDKRAWFEDGGSNYYFDAPGTWPIGTTDPPSVLSGTIFTFGYDVEVDTAPYEATDDTDHTVSGVVTITHTAPMDLPAVSTLDDVLRAGTDDVATVFGAASLGSVCTVAEVGGVTTYTCSYAPVGVDDAVGEKDVDENAAWVTYDNYDRTDPLNLLLLGGTTTTDEGTASVSWSTPGDTTEPDTVRIANPTVTVYDNWEGTTYEICGLSALSGVGVTRDGGACLDSTVDYDEEVPVTFVIAIEMSADALECDLNEFPNHAALATTGTPTYDPTTGWSGTVVEAYDIAAFWLVCENGCSLTQGYWKTHSPDGPASKVDDYWLAFKYWQANGWAPVDTLLTWSDSFFGLSIETKVKGHVTEWAPTWVEIMWVAPAGDPYYILASQYVAATLNVWANLGEGNALPGGDVMEWLDEATDLMEGGPFGKEGKKSEDADRAKVLAGYLASFNEGTDAGSGWGHCISPSDR